MNDRNAAEILAQLTSLSTPRPNGSRALDRTVDAVEAWLAERQIAVESHNFTLRPYAMEILGLWFFLGGLLLAASVIIDAPWLVLLVTLALLAIPLLETRFLQPIITALVRRRARNLVVSFPVPAPSREVILCAHLDSKTELLDHRRRAGLLALAPLAMVMAPAGAILLVVASLLRSEIAINLVSFAGLFLGVWPAIGWSLAMGASLAGGRLRRRPSTGAVDNGAAVAALLDLAGRRQRGTLHLDHTSITLLFTAGEEAQMQGALAYVRDRHEWALPTQVVNLEIVGQNGSYLLWSQDGTSMQPVDVDAALNAALARAIEAEAGERPTFHLAINSDAFAFLRQGIPAATLGSLDKELGETGLHGPQDQPGRIDSARLVQTVDIVARLLADFDTTPNSRTP
jgi:hypothetical protein